MPRWWPSTWARAGCCAGRAAAGVPVSPGAIEILRRVLGGDLERRPAEPVTPATAEVAHLATRAMEYHLERRLRAIAMFEGH
jgi:DNA repair protein RecO (recombination protein O)